MSITELHTTPDDVFEAAHALAPAIARRAPEIEAARRIPGDLVEALIDAGCFRLLVPRSHGGIGADLPSALPVLEALARADGSVGWTVMIGAGAWCDLAALPRASFDALFPTPRHFIVAGAFNPTGSIEAVDGGYRVTGRWGFASGCEHAAWMWGNCVEGVVDGVPKLRLAVFAPDDVVIEDTWHVSGLCGTGSHHFSVRDLFVPADRTARMLVDAPSLDEPFVRIPPPSVLSLAISAVAIGIAQGALDDVLALATEKMPLLAPTALAGNPRFRYELATAETELRAARRLVDDEARSAWTTATAGDEITLEARARIRAATTWSTARASVVDFAYRAGGGTSLYADCPLQRRLRDVHALAQHFLVRDDTLTSAGAVFAGGEPSIPVF
jgi:alkylation response protein AidB-like acyl-CoA dehydrogenase